MSAIAGILYFRDEFVDPLHVRSLTAAMAPRGPDGQQHWIHGSIALGHCMLRTTPESLEEQLPLTTADGEVVLVWDGRLDNREILQSALTAAGCRIRNQSDAELVLHAYVVWGVDCAARLLGDFAFAIWDARLQKLFCARDPVGARPFYYVRTQDFFAFASDDAALTLLPGISGAVNEERVVHFLEPRFVDFDIAHSWLQDVWALKAAQHMVVDRAGVSEPVTYWKLTPGEESHYASEAECEAAFLRVFGEAVRCRMRVIGDVAVMASGGLDSASIVAMIRRLLPGFPGKQLHTYSTVADDPAQCKESRCILQLTEELGANAHRLNVPSFTGMLGVQELIENAWQHPHPVSNSIQLSALMCLAARRGGHRVLLHGVCGDLVTHVPMDYPAWFVRKGEWRAGWQACCEAVRRNHYLIGKSALGLFLRAIWKARVPFTVKRAWRKCRTWFSAPRVPHPLLQPSLAAKYKVAEKLNAMASEDAAFPSLQAEHSRLLFSDYSLASSMSCYQYAAGNYGMELRDPWADVRLVEFFFRLPLRFKIAGGWTKSLVRSSFAADLGQQVAWRLGKEHLGWHFYHRLMEASAGFVGQTLQQELRTVSRLVDVAAAQAVYDVFLNTAGDVERESVYDIITLILWQKQARELSSNHPVVHSASVQHVE